MAQVKALIKHLGCEDAIRVVDLVAKSPHHQGRNDTGTRYDHWQCAPLNSPRKAEALLESAKPRQRDADAQKALIDKVLRERGHK